MILPFDGLYRFPDPTNADNSPLWEFRVEIQGSGFQSIAAFKVRAAMLDEEANG